MGGENISLKCWRTAWLGVSQKFWCLNLSLAIIYHIALSSESNSDIWWKIIAYFSRKHWLDSAERVYRDTSVECWEGTCRGLERDRGSGRIHIIRRKLSNHCWWVIALSDNHKDYTEGCIEIVILNQTPLFFLPPSHRQSHIWHLTKCNISHDPFIHFVFYLYNIMMFPFSV